MNFRIYSLCKRKIKYEESTLQQDFGQFCKESENEDESIFENVVFLNSLEIYEKEVNNFYEIITVMDSDTKLKSQFRPRTLKTGVVNYRPYWYYFLL